MEWTMTDDERQFVLVSLGKLTAWVENAEAHEAEKRKHRMKLDAQLEDLHRTFMTPGVDDRTLAQHIAEMVDEAKDAARARRKAIRLVQAVIMLTPAVAGAVAIWRGWGEGVWHFLTGEHTK
jgi:hypothetical protein